jgi:hypothetical protein
MKRVSIRKSLAPAARYTLWVPVVLSGALSVFWLLLVALTNH